jgi:hypothetical protein
LVKLGVDEVVAALFARPATVIVVQDAHAEAAGPPGHRQAHTAQSHDPQAGAVDILPQEDLRPPGLPAPLASVTVGLHHATRGRHEQGEGEVGGGVGEDARRIGDQDGSSGGLGHVDVVVAHRHAAHDPQAGRRVHELRIDAVGHQRDDAISDRRLAQEDVAGRRQLLGPDAHVGGLSQPLDSVAGQLTGDVDGGLGDHSRPR